MLMFTPYFDICTSDLYAVVFFSVPLFNLIRGKDTQGELKRRGRYVIG